MNMTTSEVTTTKQQGDEGGSVPHYSAYSATKAAVEQLTRIFAKEIGARGMRGRFSA